MTESPKLLLPLLLIALAGGCSQTQLVVQPDPQYAPVDLNAIEFKPEPNGSIFQTGRSVRLFEDNKAFRIGDVLSVTLSESTNASKSAATSTAKDDEIDIGASAIFGSSGPTINGNAALTNSLSSERDFTGSGDSAQSNSLSGEIAVTVTDILPSGNLVVRGEKIIGLNQGSEFIRISGLVRPQDVSSENIVMSRKIANSRIFYGGGGVIAESNTRGWLSRFFDSPLFPL
ncbi:MAG: flagellar basal body L-ring protein FlgH [Gammaproteobacteria bacterium]|nr:flagellar basal body L-ring protein FlgH [Gammaproteobacteria bacterium]MDH3538176.1 flagellar basal body L-ring protein FlgH [Gammaproteobacteria bacterium]